jgi:DegV family protein with EDD domain
LTHPLNISLVIAVIDDHWNSSKLTISVLPLKILLEDKEYLDGENLSMEDFYKALIDDNQFPKTSLPSLEDAQKRVEECIKNGNDVIILTISSGISGTYNALRMLFEGNPHVRVIDSRTAVGGMKILVKEANKYLDQSLDFVEEKLQQIIPRIRVLAVPETLDYLFKGGRLSRLSWAAGTLLKIKPIIALTHTVKVAGKTIGIKAAMKFIISALENCDTEHPIVPSYTYNTNNLDELVAKTAPQYQAIMMEYDNIDPAIAAHWGPNAFGFIYVEKC